MFHRSSSCLVKRPQAGPVGPRNLLTGCLESHLRLSRLVRTAASASGGGASTSLVHAGPIPSPSAAPRGGRGREGEGGGVRELERRVNLGEGTAGSVHKESP